jgi:hypothetical protein
VGAEISKRIEMMPMYILPREAYQKDYFHSLREIALSAEHVKKNSLSHPVDIPSGRQRKTVLSLTRLNFLAIRLLYFGPNLL